MKHSVFLLFTFCLSVNLPSFMLCQGGKVAAIRESVVPQLPALSKKNISLPVAANVRTLLLASAMGKLSDTLKSDNAILQAPLKKKNLYHEHLKAVEGRIAALLREGKSPLLHLQSELPAEAIASIAIRCVKKQHADKNVRDERILALLRAVDADGKHCLHKALQTKYSCSITPLLTTEINDSNREINGSNKQMSGNNAIQTLTRQYSTFIKDAKKNFVCRTQSDLLSNIAIFNGVLVKDKITNEETTLFNMRDNKGCTIVHYAILHDNLSLLAALSFHLQDRLKKDTSSWRTCFSLVDADGEPPLHYVISYGQSLQSKAPLMIPKLKTVGGLGYLTEAVEGAQAEIDKQKKEAYERSVKEKEQWWIELLQQKGRKGRTLLHLAVVHSALDIIKALRQTVSTEDWKQLLKIPNAEGLGVLQCAVISGKVEIVKFLVSEGSSLEVVDEKGIRLIFYAVYSLSTAMLTYFKDQNVNALGPDKETLLHYAASQTTLSDDAIDKVLEVYPDTKNAQSDSGKTALHTAAERTITSKITRLLTHGVPIDLKDNQEQTPLHAAARDGKVENINFIRAHIRASTDTNIKRLEQAYDKEGHTALHTMVKHGMVGALALFDDITKLTKGSRETALHIAAARGDTAMINALCARIPNDQRALFLEIKNKDNRTALFRAAWCNQENAVRLLKEKGADINTSDAIATSLHHAIARAEKPMVKFLLDQGADLNATNKDHHTPLALAWWFYMQAFEVSHLHAADSTKKCGDKPCNIFKACSCCGRWHVSTLTNDKIGIYSDILKWLKDAGAQLDARITYDNSCILHYAAYRDYPWHVEQLCKVGFNVNYQDADGCTPLHYAAITNNLAVIRCLIQYGALLEMENKKGHRPIESAVHGRSCCARKFFENECKQVSRVPDPSCTIM